MDDTGRFVRRLDDLFIYRQALENATTIHQLSRTWPEAERFGLTSQVLRSSRSVCANIAEAWRKRRYRRHFVSKLTDADAEAAETQTWLAIAHASGYLDDGPHDSLRIEYEKVIAGIVHMMNRPERWCGPEKTG